MEAALQTWPTCAPERSLSAWPTRLNWLAVDTARGVEPPTILAPARSTPNCLAMLRSISAMRTFSITCCPAAMPSMLTTFLGSPVKLAARSAARVDSRALETEPVSTTLSFSA